MFRVAALAFLFFFGAAADKPMSFPGEEAIGLTQTSFCGDALGQGILGGRALDECKAADDFYRFDSALTNGPAPYQWNVELVQGKVALIWGRLHADDFDRMRELLIQRYGIPDLCWRLTKGSNHLTVGPYGDAGRFGLKDETEAARFSNEYLEWDRKKARIYLEHFNRQDGDTMSGWYAVMPKSSTDPAMSGQIR